MCSLKYLTIFVILFIFKNIDHVVTGEQDPIVNVEPNEWKEVVEGWPIEDYIDDINDIRKQFYFYDKIQSKDFSITVRKTFLEKITNQSQYLKISLKFWEWDASLTPNHNVRIGTELVERLTVSYRLFENQWMDREYVLNYDDLGHFNILNSFPHDEQSYRISAFKDFKIEYQTRTNETLDQNSPVSTGWKNFKVPPGQDSGDQSDFIYFGEDCSDSCQLDFPSSSSVENINLTFKYWIFGSTNISVNDTYFLGTDSGKWEQFSKTLTLDSLIINVKTGEKDSFAAISDLLITRVEGQPIQCSLNQCSDWKISEQAFWAKDLSKPLEDYYFPTEVENKLIVNITDRLNDTNVCLNIEYLLSNEQYVKLNVNYSAEGEESHTIFEIRPKIGSLESIRICLRQLIATDAQNYTISLNSEQNTYENNAKLLIKIESESIAEEWTFTNDVQNFLLSSTSENWSQQEWFEVLNSTDKNFEITANSIKFLGKQNSRMPSSAYLTSPWIKYDKRLHLIDPQLRLNISNTEQLKSFRIRPLVCDWLSHCNDVLIDPKDIDPVLISRNFSFKFPELENSEYIRLVFYVEYFRAINSEDDSDNTVAFELEIIHFGDPCFGKTPDFCNNHGYCVSDPKISVPNEPTCECDEPGYYGQFCQNENYCEKSGNEVCADISCVNLANNYTCICNQPNDIWDGTNCNPVESDLSNWSNSSGNVFPNKTDNSLKFKFSRISTAYDICLDVNYNSSETVVLIFNYIYETNTIQHLLNISLTQTKDIKPLALCLGQFYNTDREEFQLEFKIEAQFENWTETQFYFNGFTFNLNKKTDPYKYLNRWNAKIDPNPAQDQNWAIISDYISKKSSGNEQYFEFRGSFDENNTPIKAHLISEWIKNDNNFNQTKNLFTVEFTKESEKKFNLIQTSIYVENGKIHRNIQNINLENPVESDSFLMIKDVQIELPDKQEYPFKIIFEIDVPSTKTVSNITIQFRSLSVGDPCFESTGDPVCQKSGQCEGLAPAQFVCYCPEDYGGTLCSFNNTCKNKQEHCSAFPSPPDNTGIECIVLSDTEYECSCPQNGYFWDSKSEKCLKYGYIKHITECLGNECELFDNLLDNIEVSPKNLPVLKKINDPIIPFYYSKTNATRLNIDVRNLNTQTDLCLKVNYQISDNSTLTIGYGNQSSIELTSTQTTTNMINWFPSETDFESICVSYLTKTIEKDFNISFRAGITDPQNGVITLHVNKSEILPIEQLNTELEYLTHWSRIDTDQNYTVDNQWIFRYPESFWAEPNNDSIEFDYSVEKTPQKAYLVSNWINKDIGETKFRFKLNTDSNNLMLNIITFNDKMDENLVKTINGTNIQKLYTINITKMETSFRIGFSVETEFSKQLGFSIGSIDLGDPCIEDDGTYNECSGNGSCKRVQSTMAKKLEGMCKCINQTYIGDKCQQVDYCYYLHENILGQTTTGSDWCKDLGDYKCSNSWPDQFGNFSCLCGETKFWNYNTLNCSNIPKCISKECDLETQDCIEPKDTNGEADCQCKTGFIEVKDKCQPFNPCSEDHRNEEGLGKACLDKYAECIDYGNGPDDFICACKEGFQTELGANMTQNSCKLLKCLFPTLNDCDQKCEPKDETNYECKCTSDYDLDQNGKSCNLKENVTLCDSNCNGTDIFCDSGRCRCKDGYILDILNTTYHCNPNETYFNAICPLGLNQTSDEPECICTKQYVLDPNTKTCKLNPICGEGSEGQRFCQERNAICIYDQNSINQYSCECPWSTQPNQTDRQTTCIDVCEYPVGKQTRNSICEEGWAKCDPIRIINWMDDNPDRIEDIGPDQYCVCGPGLTMRQDKIECEAQKLVSQFNISIKNNFKDQLNFDKQIELDDQIVQEYYFDLKSFAMDFISANKINKNITEESYESLRLKYIEANLKNDLTQILRKVGFTWFRKMDINCSPDQNYYNCFVTIDSKPTYDSLDQLKKICVDAKDDDDQDCFFLKDRTAEYKIYGNSREQNDLDQISLVVYKQTLNNTIDRFSNCDSKTDICSDYYFSNCFDKNITEDSHYYCICNEEYFDYYGQSKPLPIKGEDITDPNILVQNKCKVKKDLCDRCPVDDLYLCIQSYPVKDNTTDWWIAPEHCICNEGFALNDNKTQCVAVCDGQVCHHGTCKPVGSNGFACVCDSGWSGVDCNQAFNLSGWISGVTILSVLCLVLIAAVVIFCRRSKRWSTNENTNNQLNDYTPTTYRIGQNNQAFTRD